MGLISGLVFGTVGAAIAIERTNTAVNNLLNDNRFDCTDIDFENFFYYKDNFYRKSEFLSQYSDYLYNPSEKNNSTFLDMLSSKSIEDTLDGITSEAVAECNKPLKEDNKASYYSVLYDSAILCLKWQESKLDWKSFLSYYSSLMATKSSFQKGDLTAEEKLKEELFDLDSSIDYRKKALAELDDMTRENDLDARYDSLSAQKNKLGVFKAQEKKTIENELSKIREEYSSIKHSKQEKIKTLMPQLEILEWKRGEVNSILSSSKKTVLADEERLILTYNQWKEEIAAVDVQLDAVPEYHNINLMDRAIKELKERDPSGNDKEITKQLGELVSKRFRQLPVAEYAASSLVAQKNEYLQNLKNIAMRIAFIQAANKFGINVNGISDFQIGSKTPENVQLSDSRNYDAPVSTIYCRKCGAKIPSDSKFCAKCGIEVISFE